MRNKINSLSIAQALTGLAIAALVAEQMALSTAAQQHLEWFGGVWLFYMLSSMALALVNGGIGICVFAAYEAFKRWHIRQQVFAPAKMHSYLEN